MKNYYKILPDGYALYKEIDAKNKKTAIIMNVFGIIIIFAVFVPLLIFYLPAQGLLDKSASDTDSLIWGLLIYFAAYVAYIILHELVHGAAYKLMTGQKLTFGLTMSVAFCGLKEGYVNKKTALVSILAPFVVFTVLFVCLLIFLPAGVITLPLTLLFACHVGGCVGDLYGTMVLIKAPKDVLMCDTGPKQSFFSSI